MSEEARMQEIRQGLDGWERWPDDAEIALRKTELAYLLKRVEELEGELKLCTRPDGDAWKGARAERSRLYASQRALRKRVEELYAENERLRARFYQDHKDDPEVWGEPLEPMGE